MIGMRSHQRFETQTGAKMTGKDLQNLNSDRRSQQRTGQFGRPGRNQTSNKSSSHRDNPPLSNHSNVSFRPTNQVQQANLKLDSPVSVGDKASFVLPMSSPGHILSTQPSADWPQGRTNRSNRDQSNINSMTSPGSEDHIQFIQQEGDPGSHSLEQIGKASRARSLERSRVASSLLPSTYSTSKFGDRINEQAKQLRHSYD